MSNASDRGHSSIPWIKAATSCAACKNVPDQAGAVRILLSVELFDERRQKRQDCWDAKEGVLAVSM